MNRGRNADSIDRYLSGRMTPSEQSAFLLRLEREPELRRALDVEERITRTLLMDRASLPSAPAEGRVQVLDMLSRRTLDAAAPSSRFSGSWIARLFDRTMMKGMAIAVVGISATIGVLRLGAPSTEPVTEPASVVRQPPAAPAASGAAHAPAPMQPAGPRGDNAGDDDAVSFGLAAGRASGAVPRSVAGAAVSAERERQPENAIGRPASRTPAAATERGESTMRSGAALPADRAIEPAIEHPTEVRTPATQLQPERREPTVITADTMRVPVTIDLGKIRRSAPKE